jgi:chromosome segregation ATPase
MLLSSLVKEPTMDDNHRRTLNQFLQSSDVAMILGSALFSREDKDLVVETLLLYNQFMAQSSNKRFQALGLAEGIISVGQRVNESTDNLQSTISSLESNVEAHAKTIERLQNEIQQLLRMQDDVKSRHDQEILDIKSKFMDQLKQKDDLLTKTREIYDTKLREVNAQCESLAQVMNKKMGSLHHREQLLQENRTKRMVLEDENTELKRKVHVLEVRLDEIAQTHSITLEEMKLRDKDIKTLQDELTTLSGEFTGQHEEIERAHETIKVCSYSVLLRV